MPGEAQDFLNQCLLFDIEVNEKNAVYSIGAAFQGKSLLHNPGKKITPAQLKEFSAFGSSASFILGHNILHHDIPHLRQLAPFLQVLKKPAIDTLYLSPLAFPENPYHRLVKDYQIVRDSINDPVQDALLAGKIFTEQWIAFAAQNGTGSDAPILYRSFLHHDQNLAGTAAAFAAMGIPLLQGNDLYEVFSWLAVKHCCRSGVENIVEQLVDGTLSHPPLAYVTAWLTVADGNSVLPPWVRHHFTEVPAVLHQLREKSCGKSDCSYCREHHNPRSYLQNYYGFADFRAEPVNEQGKSLQAEIVAAAAKGQSLFATLPTGGGKSLCYLLPALMRYQRRNMLTIVISPLQALMKDQVDNFLKQTGTKLAAALSGMLTMPERGEIMEAVRQGDIGILLVSPEQLRNQSFIKTINQREIGAWVFDEAHCLSKWGHDFRPDYLYSIRFIREYAQKEKIAIPPVECFTATAKRDVQTEIIDIIQSELGLRVVQFAGGHERTNLHYEVWPVDKHEKNQTILELLRVRYQGAGSVVIYCATRKSTEKLADLLQLAGYMAAAFHAGLDPLLKKRIQENFIEGTIPVICATNAFGMGINKDDVRLVIHADIPGSLENYLQEAGRAGRDRNAAECILIFAEPDIEGQFRLSSSSRLTQREIAQFLRGLRYAAKGEESVVLTAGELLRLDAVDIDLEGHPDAVTQVNTAVSWLERAGFLERNENHTRVFQGKPLVRSLDEATEKMARLGLSKRQQARWLAILALLMERRPNRAFSADELAGQSAFTTTPDDPVSESETLRVIRTMNDMAEQGLLSKETMLSAYIRYKVQNSAEKQLQRIVLLENDFLRVLQEILPEIEVEAPLEIDLRQVNQPLLDKGHKECTPHVLKLILYGLSRDGKGLAGQNGSLSLRAKGNSRFALWLHRDWQSVLRTVRIRQLAAAAVLQVMLGTIAPSAKPNASLFLEFTLEKVIAGLKTDLLLLPQLRDPLAAAERALTFMHEQGVIELQQGLAVLRQAMTIKINPEAKGRRYSGADFSPLKTHYDERNFQIHVMNEYARRALEKLSVAMNLVASYFNDDKKDFIERFFPGKEKFLERATSEQSYLRIVDDLHNDSQENIVAAETDKNALILAGPGSGKTRIVAHRVAYLLRVKRVKPESILVLCFNRSAVMSLRSRVRDLVGNDMSRLTTLTFHGLALRLTGRSLVTAGRQSGSEIDFSQVIQDAIRLLKGETDVLGFGVVPPRYALVGKISHILVDEYQDIDAEQYELVALLAGKTLEEKDQKMTILAVGDDDQNIYRFRGANVAFIRQFHEDYRAKIYYLVENYRSTAHIIAAANALISRNSDRMKTGHSLLVNKARLPLPVGGNRELNDLLTKGKVQRFDVRSKQDQAWVLIEELRRLQRLQNGVDFGECAVLAREWQGLDLVRAVCEQEEIPVSLNWGRSSAFPRLAKIRENALLLAHLRETRLEMRTASSLLVFVPADMTTDTLWSKNLRRLISEWREETNDVPQPVPLIEDYFYEALSDQGRSKNLSDGIFLSTVHSIKGLEFDHVFLLGDGWQKKKGLEMEEERRLYYVGMSRARETLHLFNPADGLNPHAPSISGDFLIARKVVPPERKVLRTSQYTLLGMNNLYLDFAGIKSVNHPVRRALQRLQAGDHLRCVQRNDSIEFVNHEGISVARLSKNAQQKWQGRVESIRECRIVAIVRRYKTDISDTTFSSNCHGDTWEVPIVELCH